MTGAGVLVTQYCERTGAGFWAEPWNALTNLAFLAAALLGARALLRTQASVKEVWDLWLLLLLALATGIGSFLWHTLATPWAQWADVFPILGFISVTLLSFLVRVVRLSLVGVMGWFVLYHGWNTGLQMALPADLLNGSVFYLPTWVALLLMAGYCRQTDRPQADKFLVAALAFSISLVFRTCDQVVCEVFPIGTHFLWHLINGFLLYTVVLGLMPPSRIQGRAS